MPNRLSDKERSLDYYTRVIELYDIQITDLKMTIYLLILVVFLLGGGVIFLILK
jgi:hypothetical protein